MSAEKFKFPTSSYEELTKIIKGYGALDKPVNLDEVRKVTGIGTTVISGNAGFLIELNILEPGAKKAITASGRSLSHALEHEMPDEIRSCWQNIVLENDFISKLITAIKIRNGMDENTLQSHIAYSAGQPKKKQFMTGARTIIDILRASETVQEIDGKFIISRVQKSVDSHDREAPQEKTIKETLVNKPASAAQKLHETSGTQVRVNINISVECKPSDLDELGEKLSNMIKNINDEDSNTTTE